MSMKHLINAWWNRPTTSSKPKRRDRRRAYQPRLESLEDRCLLATFSVINTDDSGAGSLRQAILDANASPNGDVPDLIAFNIPGEGVHTIDVGSDGLGGLPALADPVIIDGYTQPGTAPNTHAASAVLRIELDGTNAGASPGLDVFAGSSTIRGLVINRFELAGISIRAVPGNVIEGNFLGTDSSGTIALGNEQGISILRSTSHTIGGTTPAVRNIISGNRSHGVLINNTTSSGSVLGGLNQIQGNYIGTDVTGRLPLGNAGDGVQLQTIGSTVGGQMSGAGNIIAFNGEAGIFVRSGRVNSILSNSIHANAGRGILGNSLGAAPLLTNATSSAGTTTIAGTLTGLANATFIVEFFSNAVADPSGFGEGETFLGSALVTTDSTGTAAYQVNLPTAVSTGRVISATATAPNGTTSAFSQSLLLTNLPPVNSYPGNQVAAEDVALAISGLSLADDDMAGIVTVNFSVEHGTLSVNDSVDFGITAAGLSGNGTASLSLTGTPSQINATLADPVGLTYLGAKDFNGLDTLTMTTTDAGGLSDTDVLTIEVLSAQQQVELLVALIADLEDDGVINGGQENSLIKKISFLSEPNAGNVEAFLNQVNALVNSRILTGELGTQLLDSAESILASLQ